MKKEIRHFERCFRVFQTSHPEIHLLYAGRTNKPLQCFLLIILINLFFFLLLLLPFFHLFLSFALILPFPIFLFFHFLSRNLCFCHLSILSRVTSLLLSTCLIVSFSTSLHHFLSLSRHLSSLPFFSILLASPPLSLSFLFHTLSLFHFCQRFSPSSTIFLSFYRLPFLLPYVHLLLSPVHLHFSLFFTASRSKSL